MAQEIIYQHTDEQGRVFTIRGDRNYLMSNIQGWTAPDPDEWSSEEYGYPCPTQEETFQEIAEALAWLDSDNNWKTEFEKMPKKKNGTFSKGRVHTLMRAYSQGYYSEDSYGYRVPELRIQSIDDLEAEMFIFTVTEKN